LNHLNKCLFFGRETIVTVAKRAGRGGAAGGLDGKSIQDEAVDDRQINLPFNQTLA
jgi:hypothetical protein